MELWKGYRKRLANNSFRYLFRSQPMFSLLLLACNVATIDLDNTSGVVVAADPGNSSETTEESSSFVPQFNAGVATNITGGNEWTSTWFITNLRVDDDGNLVETQSSDDQPMVSLMITSQRVVDTSHNGWLEESFGNTDYITVWAADTTSGWMYTSDQVRQGLQVAEVNSRGEIIGYAQWEEGNNETAVTFSRCDGCDPRPYPPE